LRTNAGAGSAGPAPTPLVSQTNPIDLIRSGNPELEEMGRRALRDEQLRLAQSYIKRAENTGLVLINSAINSAAEAVFDELKSVHGNLYTQCRDVMRLVESEDVWRLFGQCVAAHINRKNGGEAPTRDVLDKQFARNDSKYKDLLRQLVNRGAYVNGHVVQRKTAPLMTQHQLLQQQHYVSGFTSVPNTYASARAFNAAAVYVPPPSSYAARR